ncbi:MAG: hypothetical protein NWE95_06985 [Candidatus Bathyarchaeota archaeon]|nr:hypothetical protein [Candidatus Bathyarchaeota archaeon]
MVIVLAVIVLVVLYQQQFFQSVKTYALGEQIKGYPIEELQTNIIYWKTTTQFHESGYWFDSEEGTTFVFFNFTIQNIANKEIDLWEHELYLKLNSVQPPKLKYGTYYADSDNGISSTGTWSDHLLINDPVRAHGTMMPNQTAKGLLIYKILEGYQPTELVYPNEDSPKFVISVT